MTNNKIQPPTKYQPNKVNYYSNILHHLKTYEIIVIIPIDYVNACILYKLKHELSNDNHKSFKAVNRIILKVINNEQLINIIKGQLLFIGTNDISKCMKIINKFSNIKPICGLMNKKDIIDNSILYNLGNNSPEQTKARLFNTQSNLMKIAIMNLFAN